MYTVVGLNKNGIEWVCPEFTDNAEAVERVLTIAYSRFSGLELEYVIATFIEE